MITIKKLRTLKTGTLRRKTAVLLQAIENDLHGRRSVDRRYLGELLEIIAETFEAAAIAEAAGDARRKLTDFPDGSLVFELNCLRHLILSELGTEPADWDLPRYRSPVIPDERGAGGNFLVYLDDIRSPFNLGSIFRTAEAFGVSKILLSPDCPSPDHRRAQRSSMGCTDLVPWERASREEVFGVSGDACRENVFALELGGKDISSFDFPQSGMAVIGSEELGVSPGARAAAENSLGLVSIPIAGQKGSINVSVAFGIMMQRWAQS